MFSKDQFIEDCAKAVKDGQAAVRELVQEAVSSPDGIYKELGTPSKAGDQLYLVAAHDVDPAQPQYVRCDRHL